jgi:hypothetical protein
LRVFVTKPWHWRPLVPESGDAAGRNLTPAPTSPQLRQLIAIEGQLNVDDPTGQSRCSTRWLRRNGDRFYCQRSRKIMQRLKKKLEL